MLSIDQVDTTSKPDEENNTTEITEENTTEKTITNTTVESNNQAVDTEDKNDTENNDVVNKDDDDVVVPAKKIFVGGIPKELKDNEFCDHFKSYGPVDDIILMRYPGNIQNRGFGFVKYKSTKIADHVLSMTHKLGSNNHEVTVNYSTREKQSIKDKRFFVGGLQKDLTETAYKNYFSTFAEVKDILFRPEKGYGFVEFVAETEEDIKIVRSLVSHDHAIDGHDIRVKVAKPKGERNNGPRPGQNDWGHQNGRGGYGGYHQNNYGGGPYGGGYRGGYGGGYSSHGGYGVPPPSHHHQHQQPPSSYSGGYGYGSVAPPPSGYGSAPPSSGYGSAPPSGYGSTAPPPTGYGSAPRAPGVYNDSTSNTSSYRPY